MSGFVVAAAQVVGGAILQEVVSRSISFTLGKRKEKASQGQYLERLQKAVQEVEFILERTAKLPITEVSLLREKIELKRDFIEAAACLLSSRRKKRQGQQQVSQVVVRSSSPHGLLPTSSRAVFSVSSSIATRKDDLCLSCDDFERFKRLADSARSILTRIESGCSLHRWMHFPCPLVRHLLEWKTLIYREVQADQEHQLEVWPARLEEDRGIEAAVRYCYSNHTRPDKSFFLVLLLRLSESTDIVGIATKCMQSLASQFNLVADTLAGELTILASLLQDISHSHAPPCVGVQEAHRKATQMFRRDPLCCKAKGHTTCANKALLSSEISEAFPEEVIFFHFECYISALEFSLRSSADVRGKRSIMRNGRRPPLQLTVFVAPHYVDDDKRQQESYAYERIGHNDEEHVDVSIQQVGEMVRPRAISCFLRQPKVTKYMIGWATKHGAARFIVEKQSTGALNRRTARVMDSHECPLKWLSLVSSWWTLFAFLHVM